MNTAESFVLQTVPQTHPTIGAEAVGADIELFQPSIKGTGNYRTAQMCSSTETMESCSMYLAQVRKRAGDRIYPHERI